MQKPDGAGSAPALPEDGVLAEREFCPPPEAGFSLERITYWSQGLKVRGFLLRPLQPSPAPGLVYCRGGIRRVGMVSMARILPLARRGFAVLAPFYRGNEGGEGREDFAGDDRHDVYAAVRLMLRLPEVSGPKVPLIGFSRGAIMALLAAAECEGAGPVVAWGGVSDLRLTYEERVDLRRMLRRVVGHPRKQPEEYIRRSPALWAERIASPVLILHGTGDSQVGVEHARRLARALEAAGRPYAMELYDGMGHVYTEQALEAAVAWIRRHSSG
jgi:dipeptidyl aminopeptidase/acylaminoacyl peptidase